MRYLPQTPEDIKEMLKVIGAASLEELFSTIPSSCRSSKPLNLPDPMSEWELNGHMDALAEKNAVSPEYRIFLGAGRYQHHIPSSITSLLGRSEFSTSYTPYQPEMSQGTLQAIYEFQSLCCRLLGMDVATASHYDGATALAEAILIAIKKTGRKNVVISQALHPLYRQIITSYLRPTGCTINLLPYSGDGRTDLSEFANNDAAALVIQSPNFFGCIENIADISSKAKESGALSIISFTEPLAYGLLKNPGSDGADIVAGEGQSLGIPISFGGPGLGILASTNEYLRSLPGRLVGQTTDHNGARGFVLTLATREQHIRREKATSNICSNNGLCAVTAAMYLASLGATGFKQLSQLNFNKSEYLKQCLQEKGFRIPFSAPSFNEFVVDFGPKSATIFKHLLEKKIVAGLSLGTFFPKLEGHFLLCTTEVISKQDIDYLVSEVSQ